MEKGTARGGQEKSAASICCRTLDSEVLKMLMLLPQPGGGRKNGKGGAGKREVGNEARSQPHSSITLSPAPCAGEVTRSRLCPLSGLPCRSFNLEVDKGGTSALCSLAPHERHWPRVVCAAAASSPSFFPRALQRRIPTLKAVHMSLQKSKGGAGERKKEKHQSSITARIPSHSLFLSLFSSLPRTAEARAERSPVQLTTLRRRMRCSAGT